MSLDEKLDRVVARHHELAATLAAPDGDAKAFARLSKEYSDLTPVVEAIATLRKARSELADLASLMTEAGGDAEMRKIAEAEFYEIKEKLPAMEKQLQIMLLPKDAADEKNAILELRAGTGGDEAKPGARPAREAGVPAWVHRAILQGLSEAPESRHASMDALLRSLSGAPGAKWRRVGVAVAVGLALVAGGAFLHRSTSGDPCGGSGQALAGVWDAPRKRAVRAVFEASPLPYAASAWSEVERTLDGYSRDWVAALSSSRALVMSSLSFDTRAK